MKPRQILLKQRGDAAYQKGVAMTRDLPGAFVGQIPSNIGSWSDQTYIVTDAPMAKLDQLAKREGVEIEKRMPRTISARRNPSVTIMRENPRVPAGWRYLKTYKRVPIFYAGGFYTVRMQSPTGGLLSVGRIDKEAAIRKLINAALVRGYVAENPTTTAQRTPRRTRANPPATRVAAILSTCVVDLSYLHAEAKRTPYRHKFNAGVTCQLLSDGSVRLFRPDGKPIWKNFRD